MDDKDKIEALKMISQTHRSQFDQRREIEWKILFSALSFFVLTAAAKLAGDVPLPNHFTFRLLVWVAFLFLSSISSIYLSHIHRSNSVNKGFAEAAEKALIELSGDKNLMEVQSKAEKERKRGNWFLIWQIVTTTLFAVVAAFLLTLPQCS